MRHIKIPVYELDELDEKVKDHVIARWRDGQDFHWGCEWRGTLEAFLGRFGRIATVRDWRVGDYGRNFINVQYDDASEIYGWRNELTGVRLWKWLQAELGVTRTEATGHCELTGVYCDEDIMEPLYRFIRRPDNHSTLESLLDACFQSWLRGYSEDFECWLSDEAISQEIVERGTVFYGDGRIHSPEPLPPVWYVACRGWARTRYYRLKWRIRSWLHHMPA